jgi:hypothetical protein
MCAATGGRDRGNRSRSPTPPRIIGNGADLPIANVQSTASVLTSFAGKRCADYQGQTPWSCSGEYRFINFIINSFRFTSL